MTHTHKKTYIVTSADPDYTIHGVFDTEGDAADWIKELPDRFDYVIEVWYRDHFLMCINSEASLEFSDDGSYRTTERAEKNTDAVIARHRNDILPDDELDMGD